MLSFFPILFYLLIYEPIVGKRDFIRFQRRITEHPGERIRYYITTMVTLWIPTIYLLGVTIAQGLPRQSLGLNWIDPTTSALPLWLRWLVIGLFMLYFFGVAFNLVFSRLNADFRERLTQDSQKQPDYFPYLRPYSSKERSLWVLVSLTAGVCEELLCRAFPLLFLTSYLHNFSLVVYLMISSVMFGLIHYYQGFNGVIKTSISGLFLALIYLSFQSILPAILIHAVMDLMVLALPYMEKPMEEPNQDGHVRM
ncbi:CPBP family intramembrane glutamic endopeptidase [Brevibacillus ginsengisoli]|uniref:CPBP family intramembrane glutamic endopeptidase n=1 Tax=Brevibacillus ginsengisoli TaxID=363854 RepID=UPI003CE98EBD